jgi:hypothetical protein
MFDAARSQFTLVALPRCFFGLTTFARFSCSAISRHCSANPRYLFFKAGVAARAPSLSHSAASLRYISARDIIATGACKLAHCSPGFLDSFTRLPLPFIRKSTYSTDARVISTTTSQSRVGTRYERAPGWKAPLARTSRLGPFQLCADDRQPLPTALVLRGTLRLFCRERSQRAGACVHLL